CGPVSRKPRAKAMSRYARLSGGLLAILAVAPSARAQEPPLPPGAVARLGTTAWRHAGPVTFLAFLPDNKTLLSAGLDATGPPWDVETGKILRRREVGFTGLADLDEGSGWWSPRLAVALSPDGKS